MKDWVETTNDLIQDDKIFIEFALKVLREEANYEERFTEWASETYPELYGND